MNKTKVLTIINIVQVVVLIAAIVATVIIFPNIWLLEDKSKDPFSGYYVEGNATAQLGGYADVTEFGAVANDGKDDTKAFKKALSTGASLYVPIGRFELSKELEINGQNVKGCGIDKTILVGKNQDKLFNVSGTAIIESLTLSYEKEATGEKIAIFSSETAQGSIYRNLKITNIGSGIVVCDFNFASLGTVECVEISDFDACGISAPSTAEAVIRATKICKSKKGASAALKLGGMVTLESLVVEDIDSVKPIIINNANSVAVKSITFNKVKNNSLIYLNSSDINVNSIVALDCNVETVFKCEDSDGISFGKVNNFVSNPHSTITLDKDNKVVID